MSYWTSKKAFGIIPHQILESKLLQYGLDDQTVRWIKNCLNVWSQIMVIIGVKFAWSPVISFVS